MGEYIFLTVFQLVFTVIAYALAPAVALFCKDDGYLPEWLAWFQTFDAPLDAGVRDGYPGFDPKDSKWWNRTKWLWRNPAYGFCYWVCGISFEPNRWVVTKYIKHPDGSTDFEAKCLDDGHFNKMTADGYKFGWKVWNYLDHIDENGKPVWKTQPWGPEWIAPVCFSVANPFKKKS